MSKTDIFGKKPYRNIQIKAAKAMLDYCYVLAIRTDADILLSKAILMETNYLFYISKDKFQLNELDKSSAFQSFVHKDIISDNKVFYLQNTGFESNRRILGYGNTALFQLKRQKQKRRNQTALFFEEEEVDFMKQNQELDAEIQNWHDLKENLRKNSVDIMEKIDYLFPVRIETYEIVKPLLQYLPKMNEINYMLLEPERIENAKTFFTHIDLMTERINSSDKKPSIIKN